MSEPGSQFEDWPENLPHGELVRLLRGYAWECWRAEQKLASLFPEQFPLGDGTVVPADERVIGIEVLDDLLEMTVREVTRLRGLVGTTET